MQFVVLHQNKFVVYISQLMQVSGYTGLSYDICGERRPKGAFYTTSKYLTIRFTSDFFRNDDGFDIIFTAFHLGKFHLYKRCILTIHN